MGSSAFARHYLRNRFSFFSSWYLDVSVPRVVLRGLCPRMAGLSPAGFPHSDTRGSKPRYGSPRLFAVSRVLHRPPVPRHPLHALTSLGGFSPPAPDSAVLCSLLRASGCPGGALLANNLNCLCSAKGSLRSPPLDRKIFRNASRGFQGPSGETRTPLGARSLEARRNSSTQMTFRSRFELSSPIPFATLTCSFSIERR